jgi:uncharacterized protein YbjT (DUF2867 family)
MVLVTGATGIAGSQVVRGLRKRGAAVKAFVRAPQRARERLGDDVELAVGDFADPGSVRAALEGVTVLVLSCADDPRRVEWETTAIDAAAAGVRRIVKLSTAGAAPGAPVAFWDWHGRVERHPRAVRPDAVILQSSFYMSNLLVEGRQVATEGFVCAPLQDVRITMIDPRDVGAAAAAAATGDEHAGRTYVLTGPEAIGYDEVAAELSAATGQHVRFVEVSDAQAREGIIQAGLPESVADTLVRIYRELRNGAAAGVTDAVHTLTGRPPRSFADFAREHASQFAPDLAGRP